MPCLTAITVFSTQIRGKAFIKSSAAVVHIDSSSTSKVCRYVCSVIHLELNAIDIINTVHNKRLQLRTFVKNISNIVVGCDIN